MKNSFSEKKYNEDMSRLVEKGLKSFFDDFDYGEITDTLRKYSGAIFIALNLYNEEKTTTKTVAISGSSKIISAVSKTLGFNLKGKEWKIFPERMKMMKKSSLIQSTDLYDISFGAITKKNARFLEKTFNIGNIYLIKLSSTEEYGDLIVFMEKGKELDSKNIIKNYLKYVELILARYSSEKRIKKREEQLKEVHKIAKIGRWDYFHLENKLKWSDMIYDIFEIDPNKFKVNYKTFLSAVHPEDRQAVDEAWKKSLKDRKPYSIEHRIKSKDKKTKWVIEECKTKFDEKSRPVHSVGIVQDITERKRAEETLVRSRSQYETLVSNLPGVTYRCLNNKEGRMLYMNNYIKDLTGYAASDFLHNKERTYISVIHPNDREYVRKEIEKAIRKEEPWNVEYRIKDKNNKIHWVEEKGREVKEERKRTLSGIILDITEKKKTREKMEESEKRYRELAKQSRTFIWEVDKKGKYLHVSENVKDVIGYKEKELVGEKTVFELHPEEGRDDFKKNVLKILKNRENFQGLENPIVSKTGKICWVMSAGMPILDKKGNLLKYRGSDTDITEKKEAEERLKKKEEQFELAVGGSNDGIWDWDLRTNELYLSPKWKEQVGYKDNELKNEFKTFENLLHPDDKKRVLSTANKYLKGELKDYNIEFRMNHKKGGYRWILAKGAAVYNKNGNPYRLAGSHSDITERKSYELKLHESEEKFRQITENMGEVFWLRSGDNKKMLYINPAYEKVWGRSRKSLYDNPQSFVDSIFDEDKLAVFKEFEKYAKGGKFDLEYRIVKPNKEIRWVRAKTFPVKNEKGKITRHTGVAMDITARKLAEIKILEEKRELEKFQLAVENASDHIVITDKDGVCLYMNDAAEKITGFKKKEILGEKVGTKDNWGGLMEKKVYKDLWKKIKEDKKSFVGEVKNKRKSGEEYEAKANISPIKNKDGDVIFFVGIERDITKEREVDKAKTEFVSLASHQLRTPLSTINWYVEMILDGDAGEVNETQEKYLKEVYQGNQRMVDLVNALLNVSRLELGTFVIDPKKIEISSIAKEIVKDLKVLSKKKQQTVKEDYQANLPKINADPKLLRIAIENLLTNAVKYTPEKGEIKINISTIQKGEKIGGKEIGKNSIAITVTDNGYGIPKNQHDKIFQKLFRAENVAEKDTEGTGLGLYIVKSILDHSDGLIWFRSKMNQGTTFYATIPLTGMKKREGIKSLS